jgi:hypothetical protein
VLLARHAVADLAERYDAAPGASRVLIGVTGDRPGALAAAGVETRVTVHGVTISARAVGDSAAEALRASVLRLQRRVDELARWHVALDQSLPLSHALSGLATHPATHSDAQRSLGTSKANGPTLRTVPDAPRTVGEALQRMSLADRDCELFRDLASGADSMVARTVTGFTLQSVDPGHCVERLDNVHRDVSPVPRLTGAEAKQRMDASPSMHLFFVECETGRGAVMQRHIDGDLHVLRLAAIPA